MQVVQEGGALSQVGVSCREFRISSPVHFWIFSCPNIGNRESFCWAAWRGDFEDWHRRSGGAANPAPEWPDFSVRLNGLVGFLQQPVHPAQDFSQTVQFILCPYQDIRLNDIQSSEPARFTGLK